MSLPETAKRRRLPPLYATIPLVLFLGLVGFFSATLVSGRDPSALPSVMIDRPVPDFDLPPLEAGQKGIARADLVGKPVLVNFFASWCVPCQAEHATWEGYKASGGVPIYAIAYKDKPDAAKRFLETHGNPYERVAQDLSGRTAIDFGLYGVPETYIVDAQGRIRYRYAGAVTPEILAQEILPRLAALAPGS